MLFNDQNQIKYYELEEKKDGTNNGSPYLPSHGTMVLPYLEYHVPFWSPYFEDRTRGGEGQKGNSKYGYRITYERGLFA